MRSPENLRTWTRQLLPHSGRCAQRAGRQMVYSLLVGFTTNLSQLARQAERETNAKITRQYFNRWLKHSHWDHSLVYKQLNRYARREMRSRRTVVLLVDWTFLEREWAVLQISLGWQHRALPLYRAVERWKGPEQGRREQLDEALDWLKENLPKPMSRYVLVMDRDFPSHPLIRKLQEAGFRFVLRVKGNWKMTHPEFTGWVRDACAAEQSAEPPRLYRNAIFGSRQSKPEQWCQTNLACFHGAGHQDAWLLLTSERRADQAVLLYRERMQIEQEFRDLKGPLGLDELANWLDLDRVSRFLAWVAVYEWRLAALWVTYHLDEWRKHVTVHGQLSWIRVVREWIAAECRRFARLALASL